LARSKSFAIVLALAAVPTAVMVFAPPIASADSCAEAATNIQVPLDAGPCADVLAQEMRWLKAITDGDVAAVESILAPTFKHIDSDGRLISRDEEVANTKPQPFTMNPSELVVEIAPFAAEIHGVNTLMQDGKVIAVERFTDVFILQGGVWKALSAQETAT
jgi:hypothetical protein